MSDIIDPSKLKVTELRAELQARGLDSKGLKTVLVERLRVALEEEQNNGDYIWYCCIFFYMLDYFMKKV